MAYSFTTPEVDIDYTRGDDAPIALRFTVDGSARDFTGATAINMGIHSEAAPVDDTTLILTIVGALDADPTTGILYFTPASPAATDLTPGVYFYDAQLLTAAGKKDTIVKGKFRLNQDRTKD
ncbi:hypothetical protein DRQ50_00080 [bacterium]|nr:MAG: hypothetical protein DRQ50_00080 [bacterium]RKZ70856.1 MAG: hypothetical protein DRQ48_05360 [Gammaproteobacteria bacterium]